MNLNFEENTKNQGTSKPEASNEKVNGDMAWEEELELDDVQLATDELAGVVGSGSDCGCTTVEGLTVTSWEICPISGRQLLGGSR